MMHMDLDFQLKFRNSAGDCKRKPPGLILNAISSFLSSPAMFLGTALDPGSPPALASLA